MDFRTGIPQEPLRPTSKTAGDKTVVISGKCVATKDSDSNELDGKSITGETGGPLDIHPSQVAPGEGWLKLPESATNSRYTRAKI